MELNEIGKALRARWYLVLVVLILAGGAAYAVMRSVRKVTTGTAIVQLLIDSPDSALADLRQDPQPLIERAAEYAQVMTSSSVLGAIATQAGLPAADLTAEGPYSGPGLGLNVETPSPARGVQLVAATAPYHLAFVPQTDIPIITATVQAPTPAGAGEVAAAVAPGIQNWLSTTQLGQVNPAARVTIRQLGAVQAGTINSSSSKILAGAGAAGILVLGLLLVVGLEGHARRRRLLACTGATSEQAGLFETPLPAHNGAGGRWSIGSDRDGPGRAWPVVLTDGFGSRGETPMRADDHRSQSYSGANGGVETEYGEADSEPEQETDGSAAPEIDGPQPPETPTSPPPPEGSDSTHGPALSENSGWSRMRTRRQRQG